MKTRETILRSIAAATSTCALLAGCATPYQRPADVPTATLVVVTTIMANNSFDLVDLKTCPDPSFQRLASFSDNTLVGLGALMTGQKVNNVRTAEHEIEAGRQFGIRATMLEPRCSIGGIFIPAAGLRYEATFDSVGQSCHFKVVRVEKNAEGEVERIPEKTLRRAYGGSAKDFCNY